MEPSVRNGRFRSIAIYITIVICSALLLLFGYLYATDELDLDAHNDRTEVLAARIDEVTDRFVEVYELGMTSMESTVIYFTATVIRGERKNETLSAMQVNDTFSPYVLKEVVPGDKVILIEYNDAEGPGFVMQEYMRSDELIALGVVFALLLLVYGRKKGLNTVISLSLTCLALFVFLVPAILSGKNIYVCVLITCFYITAMTLLLVNGTNRKSLAAALGCLTGLAVAGLIVWLMDQVLKLTGYLNDESVYLTYINPENPIDLKAILFASIIIGALGATMDVAVSIAAALSEVFDTSENPTFSGLLRSGFNIGRDIMGTMTNTLILAYIGGSLSLVLLLIVYSNSTLELFNREMIVVEELQALAGSMGLLAAIPITSMISAYIYTRGERKPRRTSLEDAMALAGSGAEALDNSDLTEEEHSDLPD